MQLLRSLIGRSPNSAPRLGPSSKVTSTSLGPSHRPILFSYCVHRLFLRGSVRYLIGSEPRRRASKRALHSVGSGAGGFKVRSFMTTPRICPPAMFRARLVILAQVAALVLIAGYLVHFRFGTSGFTRGDHVLDALEVFPNGMSALSAYQHLNGPKSNRGMTSNPSPPEPDSLRPIHPRSQRCQSPQT